MSKLLFIRNDGIWTLDKLFVEFFDFMLSQKIPVVYGVIPAHLQENAAIFLKKAKEQSPRLLDIVQHGFANRNYALPGEHKYEFGPARSYEQQLQDMNQGMQIMRRWFGETVTPAFIPPYHTCDANTIDVMEALGIPIYSARFQVSRQAKKFIDLPAQIRVNTVDAKGSPRPLNFYGLSISLASVLASEMITGMVFHHRMMVTSRDKNVFMALMKLVLEERSKGKVRTVLFSDLLDASKKTAAKEKLSAH